MNFLRYQQVIAVSELLGEGFGEILAVDDKIFFQTIPGRVSGGVTSVSDGTQTGLAMERRMVLI